VYSHRELSRLGLHKAALRRRISRQRTECAVAASRLMQPVAWLDRMLLLWHRYAPFAPLAALPIGLLLRRPPTSRTGLLGKVLRWGPVVFGAVRSLHARS
jgi:hypothetical protein